MTTIAVARPIEPAGSVVSRIRITSPPMLLGRKLLKNVATRNDVTSVQPETEIRCAASSRFHRHALAKIITR